MNDQQEKCPYCDNGRDINQAAPAVAALLPCPFCNGEAVSVDGKGLKTSGPPQLQQLNEESGGGWRVSCGCGVQTWNGLTKELAIKAWNRHGAASKPAERGEAVTEKQKRINEAAERCRRVEENARNEDVCWISKVYDKVWNPDNTGDWNHDLRIVAAAYSDQSATIATLQAEKAALKESLATERECHKMTFKGHQDRVEELESQLAAQQQRILRPPLPRRL